jgi:hypothetical protein
LPQLQQTIVPAFSRKVPVGLQLLTVLHLVPTPFSSAFNHCSMKAVNPQRRPKRLPGMVITMMHRMPLLR